MVVIEGSSRAMEEPTRSSLEGAAEKRRFAADRRQRWFGRD
jgi:hypothetical protein